MPYTFKHGDRPLDDFTIQRAVGTGGFGEVYYALSDGGREVALKYLKANPEIELRGVTNCINLKSPHLVSIFDVKKNAHGEYFIVMEYCSGPSLRDLLIAEPTGFGPQKAAFFCREIAKGLSYLHDRGIVHRDLKPGNIFYDDGYVKIGDYGLSKFISVSRHSAQTASIGTVHYMAPEIGSGNYSRGVDIYALGVMLYEMLLGKVPFDGSTMAEVLMKHLTSRPELDTLPDPFAHVIRKALEKDPRDRYQTVNEMTDDLLAVEQVRESLAGFSLQSLDDAVLRGSPDRSPSPMPSPNPAPRGFYGRGDAGSVPVALPDRVSKRMERVARRIDKKMAKLGGQRDGGSAKDAPPPVPDWAAGRNGASPGPTPIALSTHEQRKRMLLSLLITAGIAAAVGIVAGSNTSHIEFGLAVSMMTLAMSGGVFLAAVGVRWFGADEGPTWTRRFINAGSCALPLLIGMLPALAGKYDDEGLAMFLALTVAAGFGDWSAPLRRPSESDLNIGSVFWAGLMTMILGAMIGGMMNVAQTEVAMFGAGGIAAATSIIVHINAWWMGGQAQRRRRWSAFPGAPEGPPFESERGHLHSPVRAEMDTVGLNRSAIPAVDPSGSVAQAGNSSSPIDTRRQGSEIEPAPDPYEGRYRWGITRGFWGLVAFAAMSLVIVLSISLGMIGGLHKDEETAMILGIIGSGLVMLFALRKTTPVHRPGFWRETIRPAILTVLAFVIGGLITGISRYWGCAEVGQEGCVAMVSGLVICSITLLVIFFFTGGDPQRRHPPRHRAAQPFLKESDSARGGVARQEAGLPVGTAEQERD
ncbi:MAG: serine/threonine protein kinase [Phycisphaerae bacterium]|nr:serine/threonine protein kinase [Phycisphaerae bacterium]